MITSYLIEQINDLVIRLSGDSLTKTERQELENSTIEQLLEKRETLILQLQF